MDKLSRSRRNGIGVCDTKWPENLGETWGVLVGLEGCLLGRSLDRLGIKIEIKYSREWGRSLGLLRAEPSVLEPGFMNHNLKDCGVTLI